ncbi:MAG: hypothetical protein KJ666_08410 [Bacteroidetes bacterium]|nr:hypothetical protein [Bacteroidota bacterium]
MKYKRIIPFIVFVLVFFLEVLYFKIFVMHSDVRWWTFYIRLQHYFISFSMGLAFAYGAYALIRMRGRSKKGAVAGSTVIAFLVWFTSCCGAPMLVIILGILGISAGSTTLSPLVTFVITLIFISLGMIWLIRQKVGAKLVCETCRVVEPVPIVHCGPGIVSGSETDKLYCPCLAEGHTESIEMPKHCGKPMKYVKK